jgi:hypothetical protein
MIKTPQPLPIPNSTCLIHEYAYVWTDEFDIKINKVIRRYILEQTTYMKHQGEKHIIYQHLCDIPKPGVIPRPDYECCFDYFNNIIGFNFNGAPVFDNNLKIRNITVSHLDVKYTTIYVNKFFKYDMNGKIMKDHNNKFIYNVEVKTPN